MTFTKCFLNVISKDDLLAKSNQEIAEYIKTFKTKDRWEDPNISGLSDILGSAVETQPEKFADEFLFLLSLMLVDFCEANHKVLSDTCKLRKDA